MFKRLIEKINQKKQKKGDTALSFAIITVIFFVMIMIPFSLFLFVIPRIMVEQDVQVFANSVRLQGYVHESHYDHLESRLASRGFEIEDIQEGLQVEAYGSSLHADGNYDLVDVGGYVDEDGDYVPVNQSGLDIQHVNRGDGYMVVRLELPGNTPFSRGLDLGDYEIERVFVSEHYEHLPGEDIP